MNQTPVYPSHQEHEGGHALPFGNEEQAPVHPAAHQEHEGGSVLPFGNEESPAAAINQEQREGTSSQVEERPQRPKYTRNRLILCVLISLLALQGSWYVVNISFDLFPRAIGPSREVAEKALREMHVGPSRIADKWEQCIRDESERCQNATRLARDTEATRINMIQESNRATLDLASRLQTQCALRYANVDSALRETVLAGDTLPWNLDEAICPTEDRETILAAAGGDVRKGQEAIIDLFSRMNDVQRQELATLQTFVEDYARYNRDYFFGRLGELEAELILDIGELAVNITLPGFDGLISCVSAEGGGLIPCPITPISVSLDGFRDTAEAYIQIGQEQIRLAAMVVATLVERYDWAVGSIEDLVRVFQGMRRVLGRPFDLALDSFGGLDLDQFSDLAPGAFYVPGDLDIDSIVFPDLPPIQPILDEFKAEIVKVKEASRAVAAQLSDEVKDKVDALVTKVRAAFANVLADYDPPTYVGFDGSTGFGAITSAYDSRADKWRAQLNRGFDDLTAARGTVVEVDPYEFVAEDINLEVTESYTDTPSLFLGIEIPELPEFIVKMEEWLSSHYGWLDILLRILFRLLQFQRWFHQSAVPVPRIVVGTPGKDRNEEDQEQREAKKNRLIKAINFLYEWKIVLLGVLAFLSMFGFGYLILEYIHHYEARCVEQEYGTVLSRNVLLPSIHNGVKIEGDLALDRENLRIFLQRQHACVSLGASSRTVHRQMEESLFSTKYDYNKTMTESSRILDCLDLNALGDNGSQFYEDISSCSLPMTINLEDGYASCEWERCEIQCSDSQVTEDITREVVENSCIYEWYLLSELVILFLKMLQYWGTTIASLLLEAAAVVFFRKYLRRDTVKWEYEEDMESKLIVGAEDKSQKEAKAEARKSHARWEKGFAVGKVVLAVCVIALCVWLRIRVANSDDFLRPTWYVGEA